MTPRDSSDAQRALLVSAEQALLDLKHVLSRIDELEHDIAATRQHVDAIRQSRSWRALEVYRRFRLRVRLRGARLAVLHGPFRGRTPFRRVPSRVRHAPLGVNLSGYLDTESGMGEAARASIRALQAADVPLALNNVASRLRTGEHTFRPAFVLDNPHPFNLVHLNADNMPAFRRARGQRYFRGRYTIGYWFWELSTFRDEWAPFARYVDEVWVATRFVRDSVQPKCAVPVHRMRLPVVLPALPPRGREHFGIPRGPAMFLYMFDVSSQTERKNPIAAVRAFRRAQLPRDAAVLVLKFTNPEYDREGVRRLYEEASGLNVVLLAGYLDRPDLCALINTADCYISPHRAEGFGLTLLEAMRLGKPVIATAYSGNMDFMTAQNSFLLDYREVPLTRDYGPYMRGAVWAEPDVDQAATLIRSVVHQPHDAVARGARARADVEREYSPERTGMEMRERLETIRTRRHEAPAQ